MDPPLKLREVEPAVAVAVPLQVLVKPLGVLITSPPGKASEKLTPANALVLELLSVNVNVLALPVEMEVGENALEIVGTVGRGQPVIVTLSRNSVSSVLFA